MTENADVDLYKFFLEEIPLLYNQAQRTLHCNDINVLEFFERRLDDHIHVIKAVIDQCQQMTEMRVNEELIELLLTVHRQVNCLYENVQELCFMHRDYHLELGFVCPVEQIHDGRLLCSLLPDSNCARILVSGFLAVNYGAVQILRLWRSCLRLFFNVLKRYLGPVHMGRSYLG